MKKLIENHTPLPSLKRAIEHSEQLKRLHWTTKVYKHQDIFWVYSSKYV